MGGEWELAHRLLWDGGSSFDAWLNIASTKIAITLVTIPRSWAQAGLPSALIAQVFHLLMGWWTGYIINLLYLKHRTLIHKPDNFTIQLHEVLGGLMGNSKWWKATALFLNVGTLLIISISGIVTCSNILYAMNDRMDKRSWTLVCGAVLLASILIPSAQNYRAWSFIGVLSTVYIAVYLFIVGVSHENVKEVQRPLSPQSFVEYFISLTNIIALGTEAVPVEIMDAMWRPQDYGSPWFYGMLYTAAISLLPTMAIFWRFGEQLLKHPNVLVLLPKTVYRDAAMVLLLIHQFIVFGTFTLPIYLIFEKMFNTSKFAKRILVRIPVFLLIWLAALAFPSFRDLGPLLVSIFLSWGLYVLPCVAYMLTFWSAASHDNTSEKPFRMLRWELIFSINLGIVLWMIAISGLGLACSEALTKQVRHIGLFAKCSYCNMN